MRSEGPISNNVITYESDATGAGDPARSTNGDGGHLEMNP
jgi:hypothetical protein